MKLCCVGPLWRGSNAGGMFKALSAAGARIQVVDEFNYLSLHGQGVFNRVLYKLIRGRQIHDFNNAVQQQLHFFKPDVLFVYKGAFIQPATLKMAKALDIRLVNFYPDVSMFSHGRLLPQTMPYYELVFTTKTFGIADLRKAFGITNAHFIPHGFDPDIHRTLTLAEKEWLQFGCDVSFIGTWSPKKERMLLHLRRTLPQIDLKIWGGQWEKAVSRELDDCIQGREVLGDLYAVCIQASKINLGILSERVEGASSGDLITSRTFHIPGAGGFMLHERNEESVQFYDENKHAGFFDDEFELAEKVNFYLSNDELRNKVRKAGQEHAHEHHSLLHRARIVMEKLNQLVRNPNEPLKP